MRLFLFATALILFSITSFAQKIELEWSEKHHYDNKGYGFFETFVGGNSRFVYAKFSNLSTPKSHGTKRIKIVAFDKNTMRKVSEVGVKGFLENVKYKDKFQDLVYEKTVVVEKAVFVFWLKKNRLNTEVYVQSYTADLESISPLTKIYDVPSDRSKYKLPSVFIAGNTIQDRVVVGSELSVNRGENIVTEYIVLNSNVKLESPKQVKLPIVAVSGILGLSSDYDFTDHGKLVINSMVRMDKEERKLLRSGESSRYPIMTIIDVNNGSMVSHPFKFENKNTFEFSYRSTPAGLSVYAFFSDLTKDAGGDDTHGIFYALLKEGGMEMEQVNFAYFDRAFLDELFAKDRRDQNRGNIFQSDKQKLSESESLANNINYGYRIEDIIAMEDGNIVLFCSLFYNYTITTCNPQGGCTTNYYCEKNNVTMFKLNKDGKILWASNLDRRKRYSGWDIYDVNVISDKENFYITYGSDYMAQSNKQNFSSRKLGSYSRDRFEYALVKNTTGEFQKLEYEVNKPGTPKKDRKYIKPLDIYVVNNTFYVNSERRRIKIGWAIAGCVGSPLVIPFCLAYYGGFTRVGEGYLGRVRTK